MKKKSYLYSLHILSVLIFTILCRKNKYLPCILYIKTMNQIKTKTTLNIARHQIKQEKRPPLSIKASYSGSARDPPWPSLQMPHAAAESLQGCNSRKANLDPLEEALGQIFSFPFKFAPHKGSTGNILGKREPRANRSEKPNIQHMLGRQEGPSFHSQNLQLKGSQVSEDMKRQ